MRLSIVDASGYIFRSYFALRQSSGGRNIDLTTADGMPTGALLVFSTMLMRLYLDDRPDFVAVVFDAERTAEHPGFRHLLYDGYKATRRELPEDLIPQLPYFEPIARGFQFPILRVPGVEADDVIASLVARAEGLDVTIYGADKDLMALVNDRVKIVDTMRDITYDVAKVEEKFGVPPALVPQWLALRGDSSDNIPGVAGVGDVTATKLLKEHGSIDALLAHAGQLKGKLAKTFSDPVQLANLELSRKLVALKADVEIPDPRTLVRRTWDPDALGEIFDRLELARLKARLAASFVPDRSHDRVILDEAALAEVVAEVRAAGEWSLSPILAHDDVPLEPVVGLGIAAGDTLRAYLPLEHRYLGVPRQLPWETVRAALAPLVEDAALPRHDESHKVVARLWPRASRPRADALIFAYLLDPSTPVLNLGTVCRTYLDHALRGVDDVTGKGRERKQLAEVEVAGVAGWGAERAEATLVAGRYLRGRLEKAGQLAYAEEVELPLAALLGKIEGHGIRIDGDVLRQLGVKVGDDIRDLERRIQLVAGFPINPGSPKQLGEYLFETLGLRSENMRKTKTGVYSTDADVLEELVDAHAVVPLVLEHRELAKLKGTHLDALLAHVSRQTGRLHTSFAQTVASTGRLASLNPNLQNVPIRTALGREIRRAFVAAPGHLLLSADYSQIELRVVAHFSGDAVLVDAFARDADVHTQTAAEVFGIPAAEVTAEQRRVAKAVNYGLGYGQSDFGLARALGIERAKAREYIETYFARFSGVKSFMEGLIAEAKRDKTVRTLLGRRIPVVGIHSNRYGERAAAERFARNAPIQGSAADVLKLAMLRVDEYLVTAGAGKMLLTVHDELVIEVPEGEAERIAAGVRAAMEQAYPLRVPLRVDVGSSPTWAGAH